MHKLSGIVRKCKIFWRPLLVSNYVFSASDLIVHNAKVTTFDGEKYSAFSVKNGKFEELNNNFSQLLTGGDKNTTIIDAQVLYEP